MQSRWTFLPIGCKAVFTNHFITRARNSRLQSLWKDCVDFLQQKIQSSIAPPNHWRCLKQTLSLERSHSRLQPFIAKRKSMIKKVMTKKDKFDFCGKIHLQISFFAENCVLLCCAFAVPKLYLQVEFLLQASTLSEGFHLYHSLPLLSLMPEFGIKIGIFLNKITRGQRPRKKFCPIFFQLSRFFVFKRLL